MASDESADKAITSLNGTTLLDRTINVSEAKPMRDKPRGGGGGDRGGGGGQRGFDRGGRKPNNWR
jgi:RNA recognition motif-containing protein